MEEKKLYPMKIVPREIELPWGVFTHIVADLGYEESKIGSGYLAGDNLDDAFPDVNLADDQLVRIRMRSDLLYLPDELWGKQCLWINAASDADGFVWVVARVLDAEANEETYVLRGWQNSLVFAQ
jgi:hypothetical protein